MTSIVKCRCNKEEVLLSWLKKQNIYKAILQTLPNNLNEDVLNKNFSYSMEFVNKPVYKDKYVDDGLGNRVRILECAYFPESKRKKLKLERFDSDEDPTKGRYGYSQEVD